MKSLAQGWANHHKWQSQHQQIREITKMRHICKKNETTFALYQNNITSFNGTVIWDWDWLKFMLLDRSSQERSCWWFLHFQMLLRLSININKRGPSEERDGNCNFLADSRWEMLLKTVGQPLGTAQRVWESCWEMLKGYWKVSGQFWKGIGKLPGHAQIPAVSQ